jgi:hypothetical protein
VHHPTNPRRPQRQTMSWLRPQKRIDSDGEAGQDNDVEAGLHQPGSEQANCPRSSIQGQYGGWVLNIWYSHGSNRVVLDRTVESSYTPSCCRRRHARSSAGRRQGAEMHRGWQAGKCFRGKEYLNPAYARQVRHFNFSSDRPPWVERPAVVNHTVRQTSGRDA